MSLDDLRAERDAAHQQLRDAIRAVTLAEHRYSAAEDDEPEDHEALAFIEAAVLVDYVVSAMWTQMAGGHDYHSFSVTDATAVRHRSAGLAALLYNTLAVP